MFPKLSVGLLVGERSQFIMPFFVFLYLVESGDIRYKVANLLKFWCFRAAKFWG